METEHPDMQGIYRQEAEALRAIIRELRQQIIQIKGGSDASHVDA